MSKSRFAFSYCLIGFVLPMLAAASAAASTIYSFGVAITIGEAIGGEKVVNFGFPSLSDTGTLAFCADLKNGQLNDSGVVIYSGGAKTFIAKQGDVIAGRTLLNVVDASINSVGTVAYSANLTGGGEGVYTQSGKLAAPGDTIDGKLLTYAASPTINNAGAVTYTAGFAGQSGIYVNNHLVLAIGDTISGRVLTGYGLPDINDSGQVAASVIFSNDRGVYANGALLVVTGDTIAGKTIVTAGTGGPGAINNVGDVVYEAVFDNGAGVGIFAKNSLLVTQGVTVEGKTLTSIGGPLWNDAEQILFPATYAGGQGYFMYDHGALSSIATVGTVIDGSPVTNLTPGSYRLNEAGQISFNATLADGRSVYVIATPTVAEPGSLLSAILGLIGIYSWPRSTLRGAR